MTAMKPGTHRPNVCSQTARRNGTPLNRSRRPPAGQVRAEVVDDDHGAARDAGAGSRALPGHRDVVQAAADVLVGALAVPRLHVPRSPEAPAQAEPLEPANGRAQLRAAQARDDDAAVRRRGL
jgi:hypothetical protein